MKVNFLITCQMHLNLELSFSAGKLAFRNNTNTKMNNANLSANNMHKKNCE